MLVKLGDDERRRNRLSSLTFVVITIVPWVVMIWLLWPRR
jgi:predicted nucleic acid-binding Zn ribbon protein